mgnify:CR=1 FL=1
MTGITVDATRNESYGRFYNLLNLVSGKYGRRIYASRWEIVRSGLGTEVHLGRFYITFRLVSFS